MLRALRLDVTGAEFVRSNASVQIIGTGSLEAMLRMPIDKPNRSRCFSHTSHSFKKTPVVQAAADTVRFRQSLRANPDDNPIQRNVQGPRADSLG